MTTPPGQDPRPGPTQGGPARPGPRGADSGWPAATPDGRGAGTGRGPADPSRDVAGRHDGSAAGPGGRTREPARADADPWGSPAAPARGRGWAAGERGATSRDWDGKAGGDRRGPGREWDGQGGRGPRARGSREPLPGDQAPRTHVNRRSYPAADGELGGRDRGGPDRARGQAGAAGPQRTPLVRWIGALPTRGAVSIMIGTALIGVVGTLVAGSEPGSALVLLITLGSVIGTLAIRRRSMHVLIPLPALLFFVTAVLTGYAHDRSLFHASGRLVVFLQWVSGVFFGMCVATILVAVIAAGRWLLSRQLVSGHFGASAVRDSGREPRPAAGPWGDGHRSADRSQPPATRTPSFQPTDRGDPAQPGSFGYPDGRRPGAGGRPGDGAPPIGRDQRGQRDQRDDRDPWGNSGQRPNRDRRDSDDPWSQRLCSASPARLRAL